MTGSYPIDYFVALLILAIMLLGFVVVLRLLRSKGRGLWHGGLLGAKKGLRLQIHEGAQIDQKRRLLLVSCDDTEYLVLIGGQNDVLLDKMKKEDNFSDALAKVEMT